MFHTIPESELPIPRELAENGERLWQWVEFGLYAPYFLVTIEVGTEIGSTKLCSKRRLMLSRIEQLESLITQQDNFVRIRNLSMLSPCPLHGKEDYRFVQIDEIWESNRAQGYMFISTNGERIKHPEFNGEDKMRLVLDMKILNQPV